MGEIGTPGTICEDDLTLDDKKLGYLFQVAPSGYVLVPSRRELSRVTVYSETTRLSSRSEGGFFTCSTNRRVIGSRVLMT